MFSFKDYCGCFLLVRSLFVDNSELFLKTASYKNSNPVIKDGTGLWEKLFFRVE